MRQASAKFGAMDGAALVVSSVVGAGIFTVPAYVAGLAGSTVLSIALWLIGGLLALAGALCYAELATKFPRGGAEYVYLREAFGDTIGFLSGWTSFIAGFSGAIAAAAVGFAAHLTGAMPSLLPRAVWTLGLGPVTLTLSATTGVAIALIAVFTIVSIAGVSASRLATNALALVIVVGLVVLAGAGALAPSAHIAFPAPAAGGAAISALVPIFFTYSGWNAAAYVAGEFRDPARNIPRALITGTLLVTALYIAINLILLKVMAPAGVAASATPVASTARQLLGDTGGTLAMVLVLAALSSSVCALVITGPRIYMEMARDGALPSIFASTATGKAPKTSVIAQSCWSGILVLTGTFGQIVTYTGFSILLFSGAAVSTVIVLRRRNRAPGTFVAPAYPFIPLAYLVSVALIAVASFRYAPGPSLVGLGLIAAGLPVRWLTTFFSISPAASRRLRPSRTSESPSPS